MGDRGTAKRYSRRKVALFFADLALTLGYFLLFQFSGVSRWLSGAAGAACPNFYGALFLYLVVFSAGLYLVLLPSGFYASYLLEHRYHLSNQTVRSWVTDEAKKAALSLVVFVMLIELAYLTARVFPRQWWIVASCGWIGFTVFFSRIFPVVIIPLFYTCTRISEGRLGARIMELGRRAEIRLSDVFQIDFSKNTRKSNAALVGWGPSRRIIIADNLVREFTEDEVAAVVAHEMGHHALRHTGKLIAAGAVATAAVLFFLSRLVQPAASFFGAQNGYDPALFPFFAFFVSLCQTAAMPLENTYSRKLERDADRFALRLTDDKEAFISMMEKLAEKNLADTRPSPVEEFLLYNHPAIAKRIAMARDFKPVSGGKR